VADAFRGLGLADWLLAAPQVKADGRTLLQRVAPFIIVRDQPAGFAANRSNELRLPTLN
jgi:hypothetical protein